jgi:hypothetical protein
MPPDTHQHNPVSYGRAVAHSVAMEVPVKVVKPQTAIANSTPERNMTKRWTEMTTQEHVRNNNFRYAIERAQQCEREYLDTCARWKSECLADGVDPELERDYYEIDALKHRLDHALANATGYAST